MPKLKARSAVSARISPGLDAMSNMVRISSRGVLDYGMNRATNRTVTWRLADATQKRIGGFSVGVRASG